MKPLHNEIVANNFGIKVTFGATTLLRNKAFRLYLESTKIKDCIQIENYLSWKNVSPQVGDYRSRT